MTVVNVVFHVHQPYRPRWYWAQEGYASDDLLSLYFDEGENQEIMHRVEKRAYRPANEIVRSLVDRGARFSYVITGTFLDQASPELVDSFRRVVQHSNVEVLGTPYYNGVHSLLPSLDEFEYQVKLHRETMRQVFDRIPRVFANAALIYNDRIAASLEEMGYMGVIVEGTTREGWRNPNYLYGGVGPNILPRHATLSDDIGYRFSSQWSEAPLTAEKYARWIRESDGRVVTLFIDYASFGEHHPPESGIMDFLRCLPDALEDEGLEMALPGEVAGEGPVGEMSIPDYETTAFGGDLSAFLGNHPQHVYLEEIKLTEQARDTPNLAYAWRLLGQADLFDHMSTQRRGVRTYQYYPYEASVNLLGIIGDLRRRLEGEAI